MQRYIYIVVTHARSLRDILLTDICNHVKRSIYQFIFIQIDYEELRLIFLFCFNFLFHLNNITLSDRV